MRFCPKCGSDDVEVIGKEYEYVIGIKPTEYRCNKCGFRGAIFPEIERTEYGALKKKMNFDNEK